MVLQKPVDAPKDSVIKIFSYACPFCYKYDKTVTQKAISQSGAKYLPWHLKTKGSYGEVASKVFAALIAIDIQNGVDLFSDDSKFKKAKIAYYRAYHDKKERFNDGKDEGGFVKFGLDAAGVSAQEYEKALLSPEAKELLKQLERGI